jgi:hypothetical protein
MKKTMMILVASVLSLSFFTAAAQLSPGIKGGLNSAYLSGFEGDNRVSGHVGFFLHHTINSRWCFQPELLYSGEGQRYISEGEERTLALDYIQVPLMVQYYPVKKLYFEVGPQLGMLVSARDKGNGADNINVKEDFTATQLGLNLGMGVNLTRNVGLYGRYSFGLTDVSVFDDIVDQSRVAQLGIAVRLK